MYFARFEFSESYTLLLRATYLCALDCKRPNTGVRRPRNVAWKVVGVFSRTTCTAHYNTLVHTGGGGGGGGGRSYFQGSVQLVIFTRSLYMMHRLRNATNTSCSPW